MSSESSIQFSDSDDSYKQKDEEQEIIRKKPKLNSEVSEQKEEVLQKTKTPEIEIEPGLIQDVKDDFNINQNVVLDTMKPQDYYDNQLKNTITTRAGSRLLQLRNFQNWVKAVLINECSSKLKSNFKDKRNLLNVCELGCGKGGDMGKWSKAGTGLWFGIDISGESLKEAQRRFREEKNNRIQKIYLMQASANLDSTLFRSRLPQDLYFDMVSMQFMANLLFSSTEEVENMFENITCRLTNQGYVLMTITDANVLVKKMRQSATKDLNNQYVYNNNQYFSLKFDNIQFSKDKPWGLQYLFYLEDAVGIKEDDHITYVPEYLIELKSFEEKAKEFNLEIVENMNFTDFYEKHKQTYANLLKIMIKPPNDGWKMPHEMWEIAHLYRVVVLKHLKGQPQSKIRRHPNLQDLPDDILELDHL